MESPIRTIAIHLGLGLQSLIAFLQLPADVAYKRTVQQIQAINTATLNTALALFKSILDSVTSVFNSLAGFISNTYSAIHNFLINTLNAVLACLSVNYYAIVHDFFLGSLGYYYTKTQHNLVATVRETFWGIVDGCNNTLVNASWILKQNLNLVVLVGSSTVLGLAVGFCLGGKKGWGAVGRGRRSSALTGAVLFSLIGGTLFAAAAAAAAASGYISIPVSSLNRANKAAMNFVLEGLSDLWQTSMANREMRREKVTAFARHCWTWIRTALILKAKPWLVQFVWPRTRKVGIEVIKWMETHLDLRADPTGRRGSLTITMASFTEKLALLPSAVVSSLPSASPSPESILEFSSTSGQIAGWLLTGFIMVLFEFVISRIRRQRLDNTMATKHAGFKLSSIFSRRKGGGQSTSSNKTKGRIRNFVPRGLSLSSSLSSTSSSSEKKRIEAVG